MNATLSKADQETAASLAKKMLKVAGKERPEIIANACLLVINLICFTYDDLKGKK